MHQVPIIYMVVSLTQKMHSKFENQHSLNTSVASKKEKKQNNKNKTKTLLWSWKISTVVESPYPNTHKNFKSFESIIMYTS